MAKFNKTPHNFTFIVHKMLNMAQDIPKSQGYIYQWRCLQGQGFKLWLEKYSLCEIHFYA